MTAHDIDLIQQGYIKTETALNDALSLIDTGMFDRSTKETALSNVRSELIKAKQVMALNIGVIKLPEEQCLPRRCELNDEGPEAA